jgi:hypothetical protein
MCRYKIRKIAPAASAILLPVLGVIFPVLQWYFLSVSEKSMNQGSLKKKRPARPAGRFT